jgi:hypothetical protein
MKASAWMVTRGRLPLVGVKAPEAAIADPESFLGLLDTKVYWDVA